MHKYIYHMQLNFETDTNCMVIKGGPPKRAALFVILSAVRVGHKFKFNLLYIFFPCINNSYCFETTDSI